MSKMDRMIQFLIQLYDDKIKKPFIAFRDVFSHLWVPIVSAILSFILFAWIPQTQDIYRSFVEDIEVSGFKIVLGTFLVFVLSGLVWYSGRLLSYKYSKDEKVASDAITHFRTWSQTNQNSSLFSLKRQLKELIRSNTEHKSELTEHLSLLYIPRIIGLIPFMGLMIGLRSIFEKNTPFILQLWFWICALIWVSLFALFCLRRTIQKSSKTPISPDLDDSLFSSNAENLLANLGLLCFAALTLPIVATLSGKTSLGVIAFFVSCVVLNWTLVKWNPIQPSTHSEQRQEDPSQTSFWQKQTLFHPIFLGGIVFTAGLFLLNVPPLFWPKLLGSVSIAAISLCIFVVIFSTIYDWGNQFGIPAVSAIVVVAIVASLLGTNNNHQIRALKTDSLDLPKEEIASAFKVWFANRPDIEAYQGKDYPVYVVSAQGGGIYAAYHAATTLAQLHDTIPNFSDHVFAISGVSGGAVGASIYASLVKEFGGPNPPQLTEAPCIELKQCAKQILGEDYLSPQFSMGLFPDLLQRFFPFFPINDWDRSRGLEVAMEESWKKNIGKGQDEIGTPLADPFYNFWQAEGHSPALVLNTTNVETGKRLLMSPFKIPNVRTLLDYETNKQSLPLSTAAGLSARFPVISSAGWFKHDYLDKTYKVRLIDGGYVDNSGLATTRDIIAALELKQGTEDMSVMDKIAEEAPPENTPPTPRLISLAIVGQPAEKPLSYESFQGLNEIGSPLLGFWNVYNNRSNKVIEQTGFELNRNAIKEQSQNLSDYRFRGIYLDPTGLPLGWLLSESSQEKIDQQIPTYKDQRCRDKTQQEIIDAIAQPIHLSKDQLQHNACVAKSIFDELQPIP